MNKDLLLSSYDYTLANELIANYPTNPKEDARLLVFDRKNKENFFILLLRIYKTFYPTARFFSMIPKLLKQEFMAIKQAEEK